jgi:hypothetical protein
MDSVRISTGIPYILSKFLMLFPSPGRTCKTRSYSRLSRFLLKIFSILPIPEVLDSNFALATRYPDCSFSCSGNPSKKMLGLYLKMVHNLILPHKDHPSHFHPPLIIITFHSTLRNFCSWSTMIENPTNYWFTENASGMILFSIAFHVKIHI